MSGHVRVHNPLGTARVGPRLLFKARHLLCVWRSVVADIEINNDNAHVYNVIALVQLTQLRRSHRLKHVLNHSPPTVREQTRLAVVVTPVICYNEVCHFVHDRTAQLKHAVPLKYFVHIVVDNERVPETVLLYIDRSPNIWDSYDGGAMRLEEARLEVVLFEVEIADTAGGDEWVFVLEEFCQIVVAESSLCQAVLLSVALIRMLIAGRNARGVSDISGGAETYPVLPQLNAPQTPGLAEYESDRATGVSVLVQKAGCAPT